jgi:hypothetical protein
LAWLAHLSHAFCPAFCLVSPHTALLDLQAVNIIAKQKKEVIWRGWPQQQQPPVGPAPSRSRPSCNPAGGASAAPMEATIDTTAVDKLRADRAQHIMDVERKQQYLQVGQLLCLQLSLQLWTSCLWPAWHGWLDPPASTDRHLEPGA